MVINRKLIMVCGPLNSLNVYAITENIQHARKVAAELWMEGWAVFCPHMNSLLLHGVCPEKEFIKFDLQMLEFMDAVYMLKGWKNSRNAVREWKKAKTLNKEILYEVD